MSFSRVSVFKNVYSTLNNTGANKSTERVKSGGAFSPNTVEAVAIMRTQLDNEWDNSFITKYQALMQNRLNRLKQDLTNAYKAILEISSTQQVRNDVSSLSPRASAITDVYGQLINNSDRAFYDLPYYDNATAFNADDPDQDGVPSFNYDSSFDDSGIPGLQNKYSLKQFNDAGGVSSEKEGVVQMRKLYVAGPAMSIVNDMKITMRTEEVPPKMPDGFLADLGNLVGSTPFTGAQKVAEYSAEVKTGGFWTTVNYLYNFAPRELKYTYATAYSTTSEEAGTRQDGGEQATLFNKQLTDGRDAVVDSGGAAATEDSTPPTYSNTPGNRPDDGKRVKWSTTNPNDGYIIEKSPVFTANKGNESIDNREITRRPVDNNSNFPYMFGANNAPGSPQFNSFSDTVKDDFSDATFTDGRTIKSYGNEEFPGGSLNQRIVWEYQHDGIHAADLNRDGNIDDNDIHRIKAAFVNHYTVQTRTVEFNSSLDSRGAFNDPTKTSLDTSDPSAPYYSTVTGEKFSSILRSVGVDGSAEHVASDSNPKDGSIDNNSTDEKQLLSGSGKISKSFTGSYVENIHEIQSFNGQQVATGNANVNISTLNGDEPVILAEYEGFKRAQSMDKGIVKDYFSNITNDLSKTEAEALAKKIALEVNASSAVDTDWHYSEYTDTNYNRIMFPNINYVKYLDSVLGEQYIPVLYDPSIREGTGNDNYNETTNYPSTSDPKTFNNNSFAGSGGDPLNLAFRNTFELKASDFKTLVKPTSNNSNLYINTNEYTLKDFYINVRNGTGSVTNLDIIVNGFVVPAISPNSTAAGQNVNIAQYLKEGENVIAIQMKSDGTGTDFLSVRNSSLNTDSAVIQAVETKLSSDRALSGDDQLNNLNLGDSSYKRLSSWQSKIMAQYIEPTTFDNAYPDTDGWTRSDTDINSPAYLQGFGTFKAYNEYKKAIYGLGSTSTVTQVKETNSFARILAEAINNPEYRDIFNLGLINSNIGKTIPIEAQISSATGGNVQATIDLQYDPLENKFKLVQSKWDSFGGV